MACLPLFFASALSDEFWKKICFCSPSKCNSYSQSCDGYPVLDPDASNFMEQFNFARKNIKNVELYYFSYQTGEITLDMRSIAGLTLNFTSYAGDVDINLKYVNDDEYGGNFFNFGKYSRVNFIPIEDSKPTNTLKVGSIDALSASNLTFQQNNGKKTILKFQKISISTSALANISALKKTSAGLTSMTIGKYDTLDIMFSKSAPLFKINGTDIDFAYAKGDSYSFEGKYQYYYSYNDTLRITFDGVTTAEVPTFQFNSVSNVEFIGKLWEPTDKNPIGNITKVKNLIVPPGPFPFSVYSNDINLIVSGDTVVYGNIDAANWALSTADMNISSSTNTRHNVSFKGYVDANIIIHNPYLNINIDNYTNNVTYNYKSLFPIGFSFNEESASYVYLKSAVFLAANRRANKFMCYPTMSKIFTDEQLDANKIMKGFIFLEMPNGSIDTKDFVLTIDIKAPTIEKNIPGFTTISNCMNVTLDKTNGYKFKAFKGKTAFGSPAYICLTDEYNCPYNSKFDYPYANVKNLDDGDISPYVNDGFKEILINSKITSKNILINFDKLPSTAYNVTIIGYTSSYSTSTSKFTLKSTNKGKINKINLSNVVLTDSFDFDMNQIQFSHVSFAATKDYPISNAAKVVLDIASLDSINKITNRPKFNELYLSSENGKYEDGYYNYDFSETIEINNGILDICYIGKSSYSYYYPDIVECVKNLDPKKFTKLTYVTRRDLIIEANSMPADMKQINIITRPYQIFYYKNYPVTLDGDGWSTKLTNPIIIDHDEYAIDIKVSKPGQTDNLKVIGKGQALYKVNYGSEQKYCFYSDKSNNNSCYNEHFSSKTIKLSADEYAQKLDGITNASISLTFDNGNNYQLPLSLFNQKKVIVQTTYDSEEKSKLVIDFDIKKLDNLFSLTVFDNVTLYYNKNEVAEVSFGQLRFKNLEFDENWKKYVKLYASQVTCSYDDLRNFKNVTIDDQLEVTGDIPTEGEELVIDFVQDDEANDLITTIDGNVTIIVGNNYLQIGKAIFKITHSENYDAYFKLTMNSNIVIQCEATPANQFVKFVIDHSYHSVNYTFTGTFPTLKSTEESLIVFSGSGKLNITSSSNLPLAIDSSKEVEFHLLSSDITTIQGPITYASGYGYDASNGRIRYYNHQKKRIQLKIPLGYFIDYMETNANLTGLLTPNIDLTITKLFTKSKYTKGNFSLISTIGDEGASLIIFEEKLPEGFLFKNVTYIRSNVKGKIIDEKNFPFVRGPEPIIKAKADDLEAVDFVFHYTLGNYSGATHGFSPSVNCLGIKQDIARDNYNEIKLFAAIKPSEIPFVIDLVENGKLTDGELVIDDNNINVLDNLNNLLPNDFVGVIMRLHRDMPASKLLNLDKIIEGRSSLAITIESQSRDPFEAYVTLPNSNILNLTFTNLKLGLEVKLANKFLAKFANFTDCDFLNAEQYKISSDVGELHMDVDSLNGLVEDKALENFQGKMNVNSANVILFTKDGWQFREDRARKTTLVKASEFKNIQFSTRAFCLLMIEDENLSSIHPIKFDAYPTVDGAAYFELSRHWGKVKDLGTFKINVNKASQVVLNTASYPIPKIFDIEDSNISYTLETDIEGKFDAIDLENNKIFRDEDLNIDFQYLPEEYQYIKGDVVIFEGNTNVNFKNDVGTFRVNKSLFTENTNSTFSILESLEVMEVRKGALLSGILSFGYTAKLQVHWTLNQFPLIVHENFTGKIPQYLELIYDDQKADKELYNRLLRKSYGVVLMKGVFECHKLKSKVIYGGSYAPFGEGNEYLSAVCDSSAEGSVLLLQGIAEIPDDGDGDDSQSGNSKDGKVSSGGVVGIVITIAVVVGLVAAGFVYYIQRVKIDRLKNEIPAGNEDAYRTSQYETRDSSIDMNVRPTTEDPFDDI